MKRVFDKDFLIFELDLPYNAHTNHIIENTRWSIIHEIVFEHEGKNWMATYSTGATEMQDEGPWEYEDRVECVEVEQREVTRLEWCEVKS